MTLYLVQHGEATSSEEDPDRPLTDAGRAAVRRTAAFLASRTIRIRSIHHSGKTRARQTAEIIRDTLRHPTLDTLGGIAPNDDPGETAEWVAEQEDGAMLVGHLPHLSRLASHLLTRDPDRQIIAFRNAGIVALERTGGDWRVAWIVTPELTG